jgi:hypothetical protein
MYQPVLRVGILTPLCSRLYATETMLGGASEVSSGGLYGRTRDSASDSDRKRLKTDSESSREQDSWSNNTSPGREWRASPDTKSAEQQASNPSQSPRQATVRRKRSFTFYHLFQVAARRISHASKASRAELAPGEGRQSRCMRHEPCRASAAVSGVLRRALGGGASIGGRRSAPRFPTGRVSFSVSSTRKHCCLLVV